MPTDPNWERIARERLRMLWLVVTASGGKLRIDKGCLENYPGDDRACVLSHTDKSCGDFILESKTFGINQ